MNLKETVGFTVDVVGDVSGEKLFGQFTCLRRLSHRSELQKDKVYRELLGQNPEQASQVNKDRAEILAECSVSIVTAPTWWTETAGGLDLIDNNSLTAVWTEIIKIRSQALQEVQSKALRAEEGLKKANLEANAKANS